MNALVLFSHGSLLCGAERGLLGLARDIAASGVAGAVEVAFLNYTEPDLATAVDRCVERGADSVVILPFFLVAGKFVQDELREQVETVRARHRAVTFTIGEALTNHPALADAVIASAEASSDYDATRRDLEEAERFCRRDPECPAFGTAECPATEPTI